jgi:multicomponent Na+:H+ antiporter subunit C
MTVLFAATIGVLFGSGAYLMLRPDLLRVVVGMVLISNAASLTIMAGGLSRGRAPIAVTPGGEPQAVSDPLVQAMTLTAIVIGLAITALLLSLAARVYLSRATVDLAQLAREEARAEAELEREELTM